MRRQVPVPGQAEITFQLLRGCQPPAHPSAKMALKSIQQILQESFDPIIDVVSNQVGLQLASGCRLPVVGFCLPCGMRVSGSGSGSTAESPNKTMPSLLLLLLLLLPLLLLLLLLPLPLLLSPLLVGSLQLMPHPFCRTCCHPWSTASQLGTGTIGRQGGREGARTCRAAEQVIPLCSSCGRGDQHALPSPPLPLSSPVGSSSLLFDSL